MDHQAVATPMSSPNGQVALCRPSEGGADCCTFEDEQHINLCFSTV